MVKKVRVFYSDCKADIDEEIQQFKQQLKRERKRHIRTDYIYHRNGHITGLVSYKKTC